MLSYDLNVVFTAESQRAQSDYIFQLPVTCHRSGNGKAGYRLLKICKHSVLFLLETRN
jgi:hypothetical protein